VEIAKEEKLFVPAGADGLENKDKQMGKTAVKHEFKA
jgi:hypothetical protein